MSRYISFWRNLLARRRVERDLDDELRTTLALLVDEKVRAGMTLEQARRAARLELGAFESLKEQVRDVRAGAFLPPLARDLRHIARGLRRNPGPTLIIVITLTLGSAGVTTMFALINGILIQPLPYPDPEQLVAVKHAAPGIGLAEAGLSRGTYFHYRTHAKSFATIALYSESVMRLSAPDISTEQVEVAHAGPELFEVLRVRPALGRLFTIEDGGPGFMDTRWPIPVLLSHELWQRRYGGDPDVIGRTIVLNDRARPILGVLPAGFGFPRPETQIWMLFIPPEAGGNFASSFDDRAIARLRPDVGPDAARAELERLLPSIEGAYPDATAERLAQVQLRPIVVRLHDEVIGDAGRFLWLLFAGVAFLLLVAFSNAATLFLLRAEQRDREIAVRTALGARRADLISFFMIEAALLSGTGAAVGLFVSQMALQAIVVFAPVRLPRLAEVELDPWVFAFTCILAALSALLFGVLSLVRPRLVTDGSTLRARLAVADNRARLRTRDMFVAVQIALALTLMAGSVLMVQSFWRLTRVDPGFDPAGVLTVEIGMPGSRSRQHQRVYEGLLERVRALTGVRAAAAASTVPLDGTPSTHPFALGVPAKQTELPVAMKFVMPGYFQTMTMRVIEGTSFAPGERIDAAAVVVSEALARRYFPGDSAIGKQLRRLESDGTPVEMFDPSSKAFAPVPAWTIAGIVGDVREETLRSEPAEIVYVPVRDPAVERSIVPINMSLVVRSDAAPPALIAAVQAAIREFDPTLSVGRIRMMDAIVASSIIKERLLAVLLLSAAAVSLFLGAIGVYGAAAQAVRRREQEIGIRTSLGARPGQLVAMVIRDAAVFIVGGTALGLATTLTTTRALQSFLFEVSATDPVTVVMVTALLMAVAMTAIVVPARRAVMVDPIAAIRSE